MRREALEEGLVKQGLVASHGGGGASAESVVNGGAESTGETGENTTSGDAAERCSPCSSSPRTYRPLTRRCQVLEPHMSSGVVIVWPTP